MPKTLKFIHITKCAGTSIEKAGHQNGLLWGKFHKEYGFWHKTLLNVNKEIINKYDWFMVVRNPYDRILSEYYCKWGGIGKTQIIHTKIEMNKYLIDKINKRDISGKHYTEQYRYLYPNKKIHILKFENLDEDFNNLMNLYNIKNIILKNDNKSSDKTFSINDFSKELIVLINNVYKKDFKIFNYQKIII